MTPREFYFLHRDESPQKLKSLCERSGTTMANFQQIAAFDGACGKAMAKKLSAASDGEMSVLEILFPEDYSSTAA